jgi:hypothetical protein
VCVTSRIVQEVREGRAIGTNEIRLGVNVRTSLSAAKRAGEDAHGPLAHAVIFGIKQGTEESSIDALVDTGNFNLAPGRCVFQVIPSTHHSSVSWFTVFQGYLNTTFQETGIRGRIADKLNEVAHNVHNGRVLYENIGI